MNKIVQISQSNYLSHLECFRQIPDCHASTFSKKRKNIQTFDGSIKWKDMNTKRYNKIKCQISWD